MRKIVLLLVLFLSVFQLNAQDKVFGCGSDPLHLKSLKENSEYKKKFEKSNADWQQYAPKHSEDWKLTRNKNGNVQNITPVPVTLSVVFHDVSATGNNFLIPYSGSVSDYQYILDKLNLIYDGTNLNGVAGNNTYINFCLARTDQYGNTYSLPATRANSSSSANLDRTNLTQINNIVSATAATNTFNQSKFINVYIVDNIVGAAGFATLPSAHGTTIDGIYISRQYLLNNSGLNLNMNVLAHEMGHYLGLFHTFGICDPSVIGTLTDPVTGYNPCSCDNSNCLFNGDMVCDTSPNVLQMSGYTLTAFPNTCHTDAAFTFSDNSPNNPTTDINDPKDNFMDYGIANYQIKFTLGQITRMHYMIDPDIGPRKSLLGQAACANCAALNYCNFSIGSSIILNGDHVIVQVAGNTPSVVFSPTGGCVSNLGSQLNYSWTLVQLGSTNVTIFQNVITPNYTTTSSLAPGNYQLTMSAFLVANPICMKTIVYSFIINPESGNCNLLIPDGNSLSDWTTKGWSRVSFTNGWVQSGGTGVYPVGSQHFDNTQSGFDTSGFDVLPLLPGGTIPGDVNFTGIALPNTAAITSVMRVGKISGGGAKAYYAKKTITINRNNCRFRVWYLGATSGVASNTVLPFHNITSTNDAAFGILNKYEYNSPVNTISSTYNSTIGYDDLGGSNSYTKNSLVSQNLNSSSADFSASGGINKMLGWRSIVLDYSEFVDLATDTQITLTFFSHSNIATSALQEAYAYYGIECLGGGIPKHVTLDLDNKSIPCSSPNTTSCVTYALPYPIYDSTPLNFSPQYNFENIKVYKIVGGVVSTTPYPVTFLNSNMTICLNQNDAPYQDFRIVYKTLHETLTDDFRVYVGFYNDLPECTLLSDGITLSDAVDTSYHTGIVNGDILLCGTDNLPILHLTDTCINQPHTFQWYIDGTNDSCKIIGATNATLQLTYLPPPALFTGTVSNDFNYEPTKCHTYYRKTIYNEPYCGNPKAKLSEPFHVYNKQTIKLNYNNTQDNDICFGDIYNLHIVNPYLYIDNCSIPSHFNTNFTNHLTFQLFDPATNQVIGNAVTYSFTGQANNTTSSSFVLDFTFDNINPSTGSPLFVPSSTVFSFPISIRVTGDYLGCTLTPELHTYPIQYINFNQSAVGGSIEYDCTDMSISSIADGITYGGYNWEYSYDNITFSPIAGAPTTSFINNSVFSALAIGHPTLYIRRKSNGTGNCIQPKYSNVIIISSHPSSVIFDPGVLPETLCVGSTPPVLPTTSSNGIIGTWNVPTASTTESGTYTFTPLSGYCLSVYTYHLSITTSVVATFNPIAPICAGGTFTLPTVSNNGIAGTWTPAPSNTATTTYTFHPTAGQCSSQEVQLTVTVNTNTLTPIFNLPTAVCSGMNAPQLPSTSINGVVGQWSPSSISVTNPGTYTFIPNANQCASSVSILISIIPNCDISLSWGSDVSCQLATDPNHTIKDYNADIVDGPCIRVCENSTITYTLAGGGIGAIDHTDWHVTGGTIDSSTNTSVSIIWGAASYSVLQGTIYLNNGATLEINKCIEKLTPPSALFGIAPNFEVLSYTACVNSPISFENLTTNNGGNDVLYYNWDFGDGFTSNEFEPSHVYTSTGSYTVTLTVYNGCSCSSIYSVKVRIMDTKVDIECPGVVCEGSQSTYSIDANLGDDCPGLTWSVVGGHLLSHNSNNTTVTVAWDAVDGDGFGYLSVLSPSCFKCSTPVKIPVVTQHGTIKGVTTMCPKSQNTFSLPQWPSTDFQWTLDDGGTGATLITNNNRNEVIVHSHLHGTLQLHCSYYNTLLGCGGSADFTITVRPFARLTTDLIVCKGVDVPYQIVDEDDAPIGSVTWTIDGPDGYTTSGSDGAFTMNFPTVGTYTFTINDVAYCSQLTQITVKESPIPPAAITGPLVVCPGVPVVYHCAPQANSVTHWQVVGGTVLGSSTGDHITVNFDAIPSSLTSYEVKVWYEGELCNSAVLTTVIQRDVPVFTITSANTTVCGSTYESYHTDYADGENYIWSIVPETAGSIETGQNTQTISVLWNQPNPTATVHLDIRKCGATYSANPGFPVTIIDHPVITLNTPSTVCVGANFAVSFAMSIGTAFTSVDWNFGDGTVINSTSNSIMYHYQSVLASTTNYTIMATVHGANGCLMDAVVSVPIIVSPSPVISLNRPDLNNICGYEESGNSSFDASVNIQSGFSQTLLIQWYHNGTPIPAIYNGDQPIINVSTHLSSGYFGAGSYYAMVTNQYGCTLLTDPFIVVQDCAVVPVGGTPSTCNCAVDLNVSAPCQTIDLTVANPSCALLSTDWIFYNYPVGTLFTQNTTTHFTAENIYPGKYTVMASLHFSNGSSTGGPCTLVKYVNFIIPYKAGIKNHVSCNSNGTYTVDVIDYSVYYPQVGIAKYEFTTNGGGTWHDMGTLTTYTSVLTPGTYTIGVRISTQGYTPCIVYDSIVLPNPPNAHFSFGNNACQGTAMNFTSVDHSPGLQYHWDFPDDVVNLQQDPVRTFNGSGNFLVVLTVTNQYGCSATWGTYVNVQEVKLKGRIVATPATTCEGSPINLSYQPDLNQVMPSHFDWYHNTYTTTPFAANNQSNLSLTQASQAGQYFVYVQDSNGCYVYDNPPVSVAFIPPPAAPTITGNSVACAGSPINLNIPNDPGMHYVWYLNGNLQTGWNDATAIHDSQLTEGPYDYAVMAQVVNPAGGYCSSALSHYTVTVVAQPDIPELKLTVLSCEPYRVHVTVANPQAGVNYYWSNGYTGTETTITHDGPIEVRAEVFDCSVTSQIDLPRDLTALAWNFPKGCYIVCSKQPSGSILGPLGPFEGWSWLVDHQVVNSGAGLVPAMTPLEPGHTYQLQLDSQECHTILSSVSITGTECVDCNVEYHLDDIQCVSVNGVFLYAVTFTAHNPYADVVTANFSVAGGLGYFSPNTVVLPNGLSQHTLLFNSLNGFIGGLVPISIVGHVKDGVCYQVLDWEFPEQCHEVGECQFKYDIKAIRCYATPHGSIYDFEMVIDNPYGIPATTQITLSNGEGTFIPDSVTVLPGIHTYHFMMYPSPGFFGGGLHFTLDTGFATYHCIKEFGVACPEMCSEIPKCDFEYAIPTPFCSTAVDGSSIYPMTVSIYNPYTDPMTLTITVPNGQGYAVPNVITVAPGASVVSFVFHPLGGFHGGNVVLGLVAQWKDKICYTERKVYFEKCCLFCPILVDDKTAGTEGTTLVVAPNPAAARTTIFYKFVNNATAKQIELVDVLGRVLQVWTPTETQGEVELNCSALARGQYLILMKEEGKVIERVKLLTH